MNNWWSIWSQEKTIKRCIEVNGIVLTDKKGKDAPMTENERKAVYPWGCEQGLKSTQGRKNHGQYNGSAGTQKRLSLRRRTRKECVLKKRTARRRERYVKGSLWHQNDQKYRRKKMVRSIVSLENSGVIY